MQTHQDAYIQLHGVSMGTTWSVRLPNPGGVREKLAQNARHQAARAPRVDTSFLMESIDGALATIVDQMSAWQDDSLLSLLNGAQRGWYQVPEQLFAVMSCALDTARSSRGAYDPTLGALVDLWGFGPKGPRADVPAPGAIAIALKQSGWEHTRLDQRHRGVWQPGGLQFDLSSIAKGYGVDEIARLLEEYGLEHYLAELGGELKGKGLNAFNKPWQIDIEVPAANRAALPVSLVGHAIATSGDYRRCFTVDGRRYAHTIDSRTGYPLPDDLASVSVLHPSCMQADAWATALLCMGAIHGPAYAREHSIAAVFMKRTADDIALEWTSRFLELGSA